MVSAIAFLFVAIGVTYMTSGNLRLTGDISSAAVFLSSDDALYEAVVVKPTTPSRADRIAALREKIADGKNLFFAEDPVEEEEVISEVVIVEETENQGEQRCANYTASYVPWVSSGIKIEEVEGARLVYKDIATIAPVGASSTVIAPPISNREILAQLPVRNVPSATPSCISTDVIGISLKGALMRNNELIAFQSFGSEVLVGYALDGFPIYGSTTQNTDACGGLMKNGQYRYQLSKERGVILNCFAGSPITL